MKLLAIYLRARFVIHVLFLSIILFGIIIRGKIEHVCIGIMKYLILVLNIKRTPLGGENETV
jgi:hypothetical protein